MSRNDSVAAQGHGSTAVPPGRCLMHGYHGRTACPKCSTSALPPAPLVSPSPPLDTEHWLYKAGYEQGHRDALMTRDLSPMDGGPSV